MIKKIKDNSKRIMVVSLLLIIDIIAINASSFLALWLRFDLSLRAIPDNYFNAVASYWMINTVTILFIYKFLHLYRRVWRFAGISEAMDVIYACIIASGFQFVGMNMLGLHVPRSYYLVNILLLIIFSCSIRFSRRLFGAYLPKLINYVTKNNNNVMIIGAGRAGSIIINEIKNSDYIDKRVVCVIDDDPQKKNRYFLGYPIVGDRDAILESAKKYNIKEIIIAIPSGNKEMIKEILEICKHTDCELHILPGVYQLINGDVSISKLRKVEIEDLLGRDPVKIDLDQVMGYVADKTVMVTGGGGSIGSELCRQIAGYKPKRLIIFDIYENNAYNIQQELLDKYPKLDLKVLIGSVRDEPKINEVFKEYRPDIVYHAAAHKHVPLMEDSPNEAIKNNVFGTYKTAMTAMKYKVQKFVLISSDKAVNPTNIMGASKRICEMIIQNLNKHSETEFVAVRFGNVLGSNGSVIPLFKKQIEHGGPITVTHRDIIRYFMTIPEAVSLVLQAGAYAKGGEIFVLDMGEPVKIVKLAENLIRLSGYKPYDDIEIEYTGLRPGEKLFEEMLLDEEGIQETENKLIYIGKPIKIDSEVFHKQLKELEIISHNNSGMVFYKVKEIVPSYVIDQKRLDGDDGVEVEVRNF